VAGGRRLAAQTVFKGIDEVLVTGAPPAELYEPLVAEKLLPADAYKALQTALRSRHYGDQLPLSWHRDTVRGPSCLRGRCAPRSHSGLEAVSVGCCVAIRLLVMRM
jgi:hypothetical protein